MHRRSLNALFSTGALLLWSAKAWAHIGHGAVASGGWLAGLLHPVTGLDHVVAMVAVGLWGAQLGAPAIWVMPVAFPLVMAIGGFIGLVGVPLPFVSLGIALSGIVLGGAVALSFRPRLWVASVIVAFFAIFHGHAHGQAMPLSGSPLAFGAGFVVATGLLHLCGIALGLVTRWRVGGLFMRGTGVLIAVTGIYFLAAHGRAFGE